MKKLHLSQKNFALCGIVGWCLEIIFTSARSFQLKDMRLMGQTSLWMFPIYGMAACIKDIYPRICRWPMLCRGSLYSVGILTGEFVSGSILKKLGICPWDYSAAKYNVQGVIRVDFFPLWMAAGLLFEWILCGRKGQRITKPSEQSAAPLNSYISTRP